VGGSLQDALADIYAIRAGIKTWQECVSERGRNPTDVMAELIAFNTMIDAGKLVLDSDPRKTSRAGLTQARSGSPIAGNATAR